MEYQPFGRYQKPKGSNIKHVLKVMLVLAICAWLLYQNKHTKIKSYDSQTKLVAGYGVILLGRKGISSRLDERALHESRDVDAKEKGNKMQKNVMESPTNDDMIPDEIKEFQSFHDENGVPPDDNEENISFFSKVNWLKKINLYEVIYGEDNEVEMNLEGSMNDTTADEEINMGATTHVDTTGLQSRNRWR